MQKNNQKNETGESEGKTTPLSQPPSKRSCLETQGQSELTTCDQQDESSKKSQEASQRDTATEIAHTPPITSHTPSEPPRLMRKHLNQHTAKQVLMAPIIAAAASSTTTTIFPSQISEAEDEKTAEEEKIIKSLQEKATDDNPQALYDLALHLMARGKRLKCDQDKQEAFEMYQRAGELGHLDALYKVANCYFKGNGVLKDEQVAYYYYGLAAEGGHVKAKECFGAFIVEGEDSASEQDEHEEVVAAAAAATTQKTLLSSEDATYYINHGKQLFQLCGVTLEQWRDMDPALRETHKLVIASDGFFDASSKKPLKPPTTDAAPSTTTAPQPSIIAKQDGHEKPTAAAATAPSFATSVGAYPCFFSDERYTLMELDQKLSFETNRIILKQYDPTWTKEKWEGLTLESRLTSFEINHDILECNGWKKADWDDLATDIGFRRAILQQLHAHQATETPK